MNKLYQVEFVEKDILDSYDLHYSFIVCTTSEEKARYTHPNGLANFDLELGKWIRVDGKEYWEDNEWCPTKEELMALTVTCLSESGLVPEGVIEAGHVI